MENLGKERLDILIFKKGLAPSREKAKSLILEGKAFVEGKKILKPSMLSPEDCEIKLTGDSLKYVGRGGLKLEKAIKSFGISLIGLSCIDVGASTGGFTDVMLKNGCQRVYAVDVGHDQLYESLKNNPKVVNLERTNIRNIDESKIKHEIDFFSVDVSFISLTLVLPAVRKIIKDGGFGVCLIKPQFEAGKDAIGKKGVVKSSKVHESVLKKICDFCLSNGFSILGLDYSSIKGQDGNIEYLIYVKKSEKPIVTLALDIKNLVKNSHSELRGWQG